MLAHPGLSCVGNAGRGSMWPFRPSPVLSAYRGQTATQAGLGLLLVFVPAGCLGDLLTGTHTFRVLEE